VSAKTYVVEFTRFASKQISRLPKPIHEAVIEWREAVERFGLREVRKTRGYHDEQLKGQRRGRRSVRLNRFYRLIYVRSDRGEVVVIGVLEVHKHDY